MCSSVVWSRARRLLMQLCARVAREISAWGNRNVALVMSCRKVCLNDDQTSDDYGDVVWFPISFITMTEQADATKSIRAWYWRPHFRAILVQRCRDTKIPFHIAYSAAFPPRHPCHRPAHGLPICCGVVQVCHLKLLFRFLCSRKLLPQLLPRSSMCNVSQWKRQSVVISRESFRMTFPPP